MDQLQPYAPEKTSTAHGEAEVAASEASASQTVRVAAQMALMRPREVLVARERLLEACKRPGMADAATYEFPRGGKKVTGPSVYLAREAARCWGNLRFGFHVVSMDRAEVHIRGFAWDLETNLYIELDDRFRRLHQRVDKETGETRWVEPDERDLREVVNRKGAILVRNAILQAVPSDLIEEAVLRAAQTLQEDAAGNLKADRGTTIKRLCDSFSEFAVTPAMLAVFLDHELDTISADEVASLRAVYRSLKDGQSKREDHFEVKPAKEKAAKGKGKPQTLDDLVPPVIEPENDPGFPPPAGGMFGAEHEQVES
jgi:hypothetical protein